jgi:hypothetical protein
MNKGTARILGLFTVTLGVAACGSGASQMPAETPTTTSASVPKTTEPVATPAPATADATEATTPAAPVEHELTMPAETTKTPDPCDAKLWWSCVDVSLEGARKVDKRGTLLIGDPAFPETHSGTTDGRNPVMFKTEGGDVVSIALRRRPGKKADIVLRTGKSEDKLGAEVVIDRHDGDEYQYVAIVATVMGGKAHVDVRYMH